MARNKGLAPFSANFEPQIGAPLDARAVVATFDDLTNTSVWQAHDGEVYIYDGMIVAVTADTNPDNNGIYYLTKASNYTNPSSWVKVGTSSGPVQYIDDTNNLIRNGSFANGLAYWQIGMTQTTEVIDAPIEIQCRSGKVCHTTISSGNSGFIQGNIITEIDKNYSSILVRFSLKCDGSTTAAIARIIDSNNSILQEWQVTPGNAKEFAAIVNIASAIGELFFKVTQTANNGNSEFYVYDIAIYPFLQSVEAYTNSQPCIVGAAGIPAGTTFNNMTFTQFMEAFFYPELFGTLTSPSHTFISSVPNNTLKEIGEIITSITFTSTFNRGSINPQYMSDSPYRSGPPNAYYYIGTGLPSSVPKTDLSDIQTITNYTVVAGTQSWSNYVAYDAGVQPKGSKGTPYDSPLSAGNTTVITTNIIGVYPWFATTVNITTLTKQTLALHTAPYYQANMVAETDTDKQAAEFPTAFNLITGVQFYNTISGQWEWMGGSKSASLTYWTVSDIQKNINGNMVDYKRYVHNGIKVGARQLRFYTT